MRAALCHGILGYAFSFLLQVLLNVLADEIHRAHQRCLLEDECDPNRVGGACVSMAAWCGHLGAALMWGRRVQQGVVLL